MKKPTEFNGMGNNTPNAHGGIPPLTPHKPTSLTDAPETIWVTWPQPNATGLAFTAQARLPARRTGYTRTDISQARIAQLHRALTFIACSTNAEGKLARAALKAKP
jgi:hypothetical protein